MVAAQFLGCLVGEEAMADHGFAGDHEQFGGVARRVLLALLLDGKAPIGGDHALACLAPLQRCPLGRHVAPDPLAHFGDAQILQGLLLGLEAFPLGLDAHSSQSVNFKACSSMALADGGSKGLQSKP